MLLCFFSKVSINSLQSCSTHARCNIVKGRFIFTYQDYKVFQFFICNADNDQYVDRGHQFQEEEEEENITYVTL